jgi:hypothetical protein
VDYAEYAMDIRFVDEVQFKQQLLRWRDAGPSLLALPRVGRVGQQYRISIVDINNDGEYALEQSFSCYQQLLAWYGAMLDEIS